MIVNLVKIFVKYKCNKYQELKENNSVLNKPLNNRVNNYNKLKRTKDLLKNIKKKLLIIIIISMN